MNEKTLYAKDSRGSIIQWTIWSEEDYIFMDYGMVGGESQTDNEHVPMGLASRTLEEQIMARINSRINKKLDSGYVFCMEQAKDDERTNALGYKLPSKCAPWNKVKDFSYGTVYSQRKLDGHHCNVVNDGGELVAYSSQGKLIETIPEILSSFEIPIGRTIEGELYHHGTPLQTISSWVKRRQENTKLLKFVIYEVDINSNCYSERLKYMKENVKIVNDQFSEVHKTDILYGEFNVIEVIRQEVNLGYEGLVLRPEGYPYAGGKRSKGAIKVKPIHFKGEFATEKEFLVVDILSSKDGYARLICDNGYGKTFAVLCHGDNEYKREVYQNKKSFIHKHVEVELAGWTKSKLPQHPVSKRWREKYEE
ncbi:MAG: hypothetical protein K0U78_15260 [Actinomycetia bacterium]|nr:hypothetical protein [Actinomycetes bacterium]